MAVIAALYLAGVDANMCVGAPGKPAEVDAPAFSAHVLLLLASSKWQALSAGLLTGKVGTVMFVFVSWCWRLIPVCDLCADAPPAGIGLPRSISW